MEWNIIAWKRINNNKPSPPPKQKHTQEQGTTISPLHFQQPRKQSCFKGRNPRMKTSKAGSYASLLEEIHPKNVNQTIPSPFNLERQATSCLFDSFNPPSQQQQQQQQQ